MAIQEVGVCSIVDIFTGVYAAKGTTDSVVMLEENDGGVAGGRSEALVRRTTGELAVFVVRLGW